MTNHDATVKVTLYDGRKVDYRETHPDYNTAHRSLVGRGFTCNTQSYDEDDNVTGAKFGHTINPKLRARIWA